MVCLVCANKLGAALCESCRASLRPVSPVRVEDLGWVWPAFSHEGAARVLVHRLKYEGFMQAAALLAPGMARQLPGDSRCLVPVPRVVWRRVILGIDPGEMLARAVSRLSGLEVVPSLTPSLVGPVHAGRSRSRRQAPIFNLRRRPPAGAVLVDDVITTGITMRTAMSITEIERAVTATAAKR